MTKHNQTYERDNRLFVDIKKALKRWEGEKCTYVTGEIRSDNPNKRPSKVTFIGIGHRNSVNKLAHSLAISLTKQYDIAHGFINIKPITRNQFKRMSYEYHKHLGLNDSLILYKEQ